jgi:signal transduction histidine kinase
VAAAAAEGDARSTDADATGAFDLASVLKASEAIGAEVRLDTLVARLLHIVIENAGAERGALVLDGENGAMVHSHERGAPAPVIEPLDASTRVPSAVVQYVRRTGETVVLGQGAEADAEGSGPRLPAGLGDDDDLRRHAPRSMACLPVRRLSRTAGVLYVEHRQAAGLYTPARLAVLRVLATQAAMAVENARLVDGLRGALAEVQRLKDDLEAENSFLRRDLIANVSHDLRTPLVSLRGYLEVVATKGESLGEPQRAQYLGIALRQSERLAALIDELFELARLDYRGLALKRERFAFDELAADVVQKYRLAAESRRIALVAEASPGLPFVDADLGLVERVLENLIGNALRHTPEGGTVRVSARGQGGHIVAEVSDSGPGIAPEDLPHVFDRHFRGTSDARGSSAERGAGLGLAIARRIVELHGGTIAAESGATTADGRTPGARLWFTLPVAGRA